MGQIRKINGVFYIEFYARGLLYSQVAGTDIDDAQRLLDQVEGKISRGEALTIARHIELGDFFDRFLSEIKIAHPKGKTPQRFEGTIKNFNIFLNAEYPHVHQLAQLTPAILESYKAYLSRTQKIKIVNLTLLLMRDILEFGIKLNFINDNPSLHVRLFAWPAKRPLKKTPRYDKIKELLSKRVGLGKITQLLNLPDIARTIYYANLIPLSREDVYN